jgi:hypothetical protein
MANYNTSSALSVFVIAGIMAGCVTPGNRAVEQSDPSRLEKIVSQPNHGGEDLDELLKTSVIADCPKCADEVLRAGAKPDSELLAAAAIDGHEKLVQSFIANGAEPAAAIADIQRRAGAAFSNFSHEQAQASIDLIRRVARGETHPSIASVPIGRMDDEKVPAGTLTPLFHEAERPDDYALVVGVEKYNDLPAATYADADAGAAAEFIRALGVPARNVTLLTGERATRSGIVKQLEGWLANNTNDKSTIYFYFSGHGSPDPSTGEAYLVPRDGDPQYLADTAYPLKRLYEKLGTLKAKRVIVMLDSCFSGAGGRSVLAKGSRPLISSVDTGFQPNDRRVVALTASGADQISGTSEESGHGLFTYHLLSGLNGSAKNASGQVTLQSLYDYLKPKVMDDAHRKNRLQIPQFQGVGGADSIVLRDK